MIRKETESSEQCYLNLLASFTKDLLTANCVLLTFQSHRALQSLNIQHSRDVFNRSHDFVEVLYVKYFDRNFDAAFLIRTYGGAGIANAGLHI